MAARLWEFESPPPHHEIKSPLPVREEGFLVFEAFSSKKMEKSFFLHCLKCFFFGTLLRMAVRRGWVVMSMDWESWLRGEAFPPLKQEDPDKTIGASQAELLGLPVVLSGETPESRSAPVDAEEPRRAPQTGDSADVEVSGADGTKALLPQATEIQGEPSAQQDMVFPVVSEVVETAETEQQVSAPEFDGETQDPNFSEATEEESFSDTENADHAALSEAERHDEIFLPSGESEEPLPPADEPHISDPVQQEIDENGNAVSTFIIPAYPLYPLAEDDSGTEKTLFIEASRNHAQAQRDKTTKNRVLPICLLAAMLLLGGLFFVSGESFETVMQQGDQAYAQKEYDRALHLYEKAAEKNPLRVEPLFGKARTLEEMDRKGEAVHAWNSCLKIAPEDAEVYRRLGALLFELGSLDNAIRNYQESVRFEPENAETHFLLGSLWESREDVPQALESYRKALEIDSTRSDFAEAVERTEKEVRILEEERRRRTAMAEEQIRLGAAFLVTGEYSEAEGHFLRALDLVPEGEDALLGLAEARIGKGDIDGAKETYRSLLALAPHSEQARAALLALEPPATDSKEPVLSDGRSIPLSEQHGHAVDGAASFDIASAGPTMAPEVSREAEQSADVARPEERIGKTTAEALGEEETTPPVIPPGSGVPSPLVSKNAVAVSLLSSGDTLPEKTDPAVEKAEKEEFSQGIVLVSAEKKTASDAPLPGDEIHTTEELVPAESKEPPIKKAASPKTPHNGRIVKATVSPVRSLPRQSPRAPAPGETDQKTRSAPAKSEERVLETSRSYNLSGEYSKAAQKASEALHVQQSPEALSNLGYAHIGMGNYPAAFTAYWRRLLLSPTLRNVSLEPPAFLSLPFQEGRWKEIPAPNPKDLPGVVGSEKIVLLPGGNAVLSGVLPGKEYLFEALRINPAEKDVYLNLALSYLMMQNQGVSSASLSASPAGSENEKALYLALLAHALRVKKADEQSDQFLNAAAARASGEVLRFVRSLETKSDSDTK